MYDITLWLLIFIVIVAIIMFTNKQTVEDFFLYYPDCYYNASNNLVCNEYVYWPDFWAGQYYYSQYPKSYEDVYNMSKALDGKPPVQWPTPQPIKWTSEAQATDQVQAF